MEIVRYSSCAKKEKYLSQIEKYEWSAAKFLAKLLKENRLSSVLGGWGEVYLLVDGDTIVSFITLSAQDCISDINLTPWLGFFHTAPTYRGNRYGKILIDRVCQIARDDGYRAVYLATEHIGLYEKYGFEYFENHIDVFGEDSRVYKREL